MAKPPPPTPSTEPLEPMSALELVHNAILADAKRVTAGPINRSLKAVRRPSKKRGADMLIAITDSLAKALRGDADKRPVLLLVAVDRDLAVELEAVRAAQKRQAETGLILPPGVG